MIERVARAIFESEYNGGEADEYRWERSKDAYFNQARAAIEAMREPTDAMLYDMDGYSDLVGPYPEANTKEERLREFRGAYQVAIDKALSE